MSQVPIPQDWDGVSYCCHIVEWPDSDDWRAILFGLITWPKRGRFWDGATGSIVDAQEVGLQIFVRNFLEGCNMAGCLEDLTIAIDCLCQAIYNTRLGGGSGGAGVVASAAEDFIDDGVGFPAGYTDRPEYDTAKCNLAQFVINRILDDFDRLKVVNAAGKSAAAVASILTVTLLTPIPLDELIVGVAAAILGLVAASVAAFNTAIDELKARFSAMDICLLYEAQTVGDAITEVETWISAGSYSLQTLTVLLGNSLIGTDSLNVLFADKDDQISYDSLPTGDCSGCEDCICAGSVMDIYEITSGTLVSTSGTNPVVLTIDSVAVAANGNAQNITLFLPDNGCRGVCCATITAASVVSGANGTVVNGFNDCVGTSMPAIDTVAETIGEEFWFVRYQQAAGNAYRMEITVSMTDQ